MRYRAARRRKADRYLRYLNALGEDVIVPWSVCAYLDRGRMHKPRSSRRRKLRDYDWDLRSR